MSNKSATQLWLKYIDFETTRNNLAVVNLLCWMSLEQPMTDSEKLLEKYTDTLNSLLKDIVDSFETPEQKALMARQLYKDKQNEIATKFNGMSAADIIDQLLKPMLEKSSEELKKRQEFEDKCTNSDIKNWQEYIEFEIKEEKFKRAKHLYERALGSSPELYKNLDLWLDYIKFLQEHIKDTTLVRAMYEQKFKHSKRMTPKDRVKLLIENGLYEEKQGNIPRARKIFESLETEIAPGLI